jgi:hypothetical protein
VRYEQGDAEGLRAALGEAILSSAVATYPRVGARILGLKAWLAALDGDDASALAFEEQSLALFRRLRDQQGLASGCLEAARRALDRSDWPKAGRFLTETLSIGRATGDQLALAHGLEEVAHLAASIEPEQVTRLLRAAEMVRSTHGLGRTPLDQAQFERWPAAARQELPEAALTRAQEDGESEPLAQAIALAMHIAEAAATHAAGSDAPS